MNGDNGVNDDDGANIFGWEGERKRRRRRGRRSRRRIQKGSCVAGCCCAVVVVVVCWPGTMEMQGPMGFAWDGNAKTMPSRLAPLSKTRETSQAKPARLSVPPSSSKSKKKRATGGRQAATLAAIVAYSSSSSSSSSSNAEKCPLIYQIISARHTIPTVWDED
jgi:hypothetical protein